MAKKTIIIIAIVLLLSAAALIIATVVKNRKQKRALGNGPAPRPGRGNGLAPSDEFPTGTGTGTGGEKPVTYTPVFPLQQGSRGNFVRYLQNAIGVAVDGVMGPKTVSALKKKTGMSNLNEVEYNKIVYHDQLGRLGMKPEFLKSLKMGATGYWVRVLQIHLGLTPTGNFGEQTKKAAIAAGYRDGEIPMADVVKMPLAPVTVAQVPFVNIGVPFVPPMLTIKDNS